MSINNIISEATGVFSNKCKRVLTILVGEFACQKSSETSWVELQISKRMHQAVCRTQNGHGERQNS